MKWLVILGILGLAPIWRDPGWQGGVSFYEMLYNYATKPQKHHIPVEEAIEKARQAYQSSLLV